MKLCKFSIVDESWWSGKLRRNGAEGIFPKDYVTVLEDKLNHSMSSLSLQDGRTTPTKQVDDHSRRSAGTTPLGNFSKLKTSQSFANDSIEYDQDHSFNQSFDDRYSKTFTPTKEMFDLPNTCCLQ